LGAIGAGTVLAGRPLAIAGRPVGAAMICFGALCLAASPAMADQSIPAADNGTVACIASAKDLTRISLAGDQFASVSKISTGNPAEDFKIVNEPVRGDIYISVPDGFTKPNLSFFGTTRKGFVYKFLCQVRGSDAEQVFVTNTAVKAEAARDWEVRSSPEDTAVRLAQAMYRSETIEGFEIRQSVLEPVAVGKLEVQQVGEYRGADLEGPDPQGSEHRERAPAARREPARSARQRRLHDSGERARAGQVGGRLPHPIEWRPVMDWKNPFRKGPKSLDGPASEAGSSDASPLGDAIVANEAVKKKQMLLLGAGGLAALIIGSSWIFAGENKSSDGNVKRQVADVSVDEMVNKNMAEKEWRAQSEAQMMSMDNNMRALAARAQRADQLEAQLAQSQAQGSTGEGGFRPTPNGCSQPTRTRTSS